MGSPSVLKAAFHDNDTGTDIVADSPDTPTSSREDVAVSVPWNAAFRRTILFVCVRKKILSLCVSTVHTHTHTHDYWILTVVRGETKSIASHLLLSRLRSVTVVERGDGRCIDENSARYHRLTRGPSSG